MSRSGENLVVAPSQPRPGLLLIRVLGAVDADGAARCSRVLRGAVDAAAAEHDTRGASARVVCDVSEVGTLGEPGRRVLADAEAYAHVRDVAFEVVDGVRTTRDGRPPTVPVAG